MTANKRLIRLAGPIFAISVGLGIISVSLFFLQQTLMYYPRRYPSELTPGEGDYGDFHPYTTADGRKQWGMLIEPRDAPRPAAGPRFYIFYYGNGGTAVAVKNVVKTLAAKTGCGFFVPDYRGYGFNPGYPTESGLVADALGAYDTMAAEGRFKDGVGIMGVSLGGGASFAVASQRHVDRLVTISTFTSMDEMAKRGSFWPVYLFCVNHWPNEQRMKELIKRPAGERPKDFYFLHGKRDPLIPFSMAERLATVPGADAPNSGVHFIPLEKAVHADVLDQSAPELEKILKE
ncbi:alpha/beta hydrolase [Candidatus Sumerlaeota bacterium]|nr:alpha/beta hydrolase [Candidatus Sumerlaeota bacterium]